MQDFLNSYLQPYLLELIVGVVSALLYKLLQGRVAQDTLHRAIKSGAEHAIYLLKDGKITKEELIETVLRYSFKSSPDAMGLARGNMDVLEGLAAAKLNELL